MKNHILAWVLACLTVFCVPALAQDAGEIDAARLPQEAKQMLQQIKQGGPFAYPKDGTVFGNYEQRLPKEARGYYREYTVPTPGLSHRGARRIVSGGQPPQVFYYTEDHYNSFKKIR